MTFWRFQEKPMTFAEYVKMRETAGDSWGTAPAPPVQIMLGPNAPIAGNTKGARPPGKEEQFGKEKKRKKPPREITQPSYDDRDLIKRNMYRAKELGVNP
jgi:hypothetical protein